MDRAHGRILVLDRDDAKETTGHGSPLPVLVHGGPGRAGGGGGELGGIRGVLHHMQRTAIQASPDQLTAIGGRWVTGARRHQVDVHPFRKSLVTLRIGDSITAGPRTVTLEDIEHVAEFTGDRFYAHMDEEAAANPLFGGRVHTATSSLPGRPASSSTLRQGRCSPTTAWTTRASSPRSSRERS
jgi:oxepin-CoA hydrolase/3-oxo-5,6-dehydrosuberyl-CoA semialdehyde dehydrogenase